MHFQHNFVKLGNIKSIIFFSIAIGMSPGDRKVQLILKSQNVEFKYLSVDHPQIVDFDDKVTL